MLDLDIHEYTSLQNNRIQDMLEDLTVKTDEKQLLNFKELDSIFLKTKTDMQNISLELSNFIAFVTFLWLFRQDSGR